MRRTALTSGHRPLLMIILLIIVFTFTNACQAPSDKGEEMSTQKGADDHAAWSKDDVIYEVNIRQYTPEGTFTAFEEHLPRLKEMGVDILWLMPIHPIGEKNRKGTLGSYYSVKDYLAVNPEFGNIEDFRSLVEKIHKLDMYIILDWVANHTAWDNNLTEEHPGWYEKDSAGNFISPFDWTDVISLDYSKPGLREYMKNVLAHWVAEENIDGYRCDVAGMVPTDFWNEVRDTLDKIKPVFMLAEAEEPGHHQTAFDMSYAWNIHHVMNEIAQGMQDANDLHAVIVQDMIRFPRHAYRMYFTSNHDENSWNGTVYERLGDAAQCFAALTYIMPGLPLIYSGQEAGLNKRLKFFDKDTINWESMELEEFYTDLNKLKKENKALWNGQYGGEYIRVEINNEDKVIAIFRQKDNNKVLGLFNFTDTPVEDIKLKGEMHLGDYISLQSGEKVAIDRNTVFDLAPWEYKIMSH